MNIEYFTVFNILVRITNLSTSPILIQMCCHWVNFMNLSSLRCWDHSSSVVCQRYLLQSSAFSQSSNNNNNNAIYIAQIRTLL